MRKISLFIAALVLLVFSTPKVAFADTLPIVATNIESTQLEITWDGINNNACEHAVACDPGDSLSYVVDVNTLEQRDVLNFYDIGYNVGIVNWTLPLETGHTYKVQMHGPGDTYRITQEFAYTGATLTNFTTGTAWVNRLDISGNTNVTLGVFSPSLPAIDGNCLLNGANELSVDIYVNGVNRQTVADNCSFTADLQTAMSFSTNDLFGNGNYYFVVHSVSTGNVWTSNPINYTAPVFVVSNLTFNHSTGQYAFNYSGYSGGNITGESVAIHADDESWGYNHEPATCSGGATGSGTCSGTFNYNQGVFSCSNTMYVQVYGYHSGGAVHGLTNPDQSCQIRVDSTEWLDSDTFRIHYSNNPHPGEPIGLIYVEGDGSFHAGAWSWQTSAASGYVDFGADLPGADMNSLYWSGEPGYTRWYKLNSGVGLSDMFRLPAFDDSTPPLDPFGTFTASDVSYNPTTHQLSFHASNFSQPVTQTLNIGITSCNTPGCSAEETEFYSAASLTSVDDPHNFDAVLSINSYRPSNGTVYVEFSDAGTTYQRMWSQALNYNDIAPVSANLAPTVSFSASNTTINEGDTFTANGSFTDPDSTSWTATVDYGDGSGVQPLALNPDKTFSLSHVYVDNGSYTIAVSVTDNGGLSGTSTGSGGGSVVVNNPAPTVPPITPPTNVDQNNPANIHVVFTDYGNQTHTATVNWGDGSGNQSVPVSGNDFSSDHPYQNPGTYTVVVTIVDSEGATTTQTLTITVLNVAAQVGVINFPSNVGVSNATPLSVTFTDPGTIDTHTATINWGDGNTTNGVVTESNGTGTVNGSHSYSSPGAYQITVAVTDDDNGVGQSTANTTAVNQISALSPAGLWIGLKNSDDVGTKFDLRVEAYKNNTLVASGQLDSFAGGSSGFNNAHLATIPFDSFAATDLPTGAILSLKVYVRNACVGSGHNSGTARLWFNDSAANSAFGTTVAGSNSTYYLKDAFALSTTVGAGPKKTIDVQSGAKCSAFKPFGAWATAP